MKKISIFLFVLILIGCKRNITVTDIVIDPNPPSTVDTITCIAITESLSNKGTFKWKITTQYGEEVSIIEEKKNLVKWRASHTGIYNIEVTHKKSGKSEFYSETIEVLNNSVPYYKAALVGKWTGTGDTPSAWTPDIIQINVEFFEDGTYSAQCLNTGPCVAFYYGSDVDHSDKKYFISGADESGAFGTITLYFAGSGNFTIETISEINFSNSNQTLEFNFYRTSSGGIYGPIKYVLERVP